MHLFSKTRKINMHRNGLLKGIIYTAALGSCFSVGQNIADAKDKITKPVEGPELSGPIRAGRGTMEEGQAILLESLTPILPMVPFSAAIICQPLNSPCPVPMLVTRRRKP